MVGKGVQQDTISIPAYGVLDHDSCVHYWVHGDLKRSTCIPVDTPNSKNVVIEKWRKEKAK